MKKPFQVGDRVAAYQNRITGTITAIDENPNLAGPIEITYNNGKAVAFVKPEQCRRLVKKPRRRIWMGPASRYGRESVWEGCFSDKPIEGYEREFVEVRKKK